MENESDKESDAPLNEDEMFDLAIALSQSETAENISEQVGDSSAPRKSLTEQEMLDICLALSMEDGERVNVRKEMMQCTTEGAEDKREEMFSTALGTPISSENIAPDVLSAEEWDKPHPFIVRGEDNKLTINSAIANYIQSLETPLVVVSIAGLYRTGKSYLLNLLAGRQRGFPLGSTVQSETKGIWIWVTAHPVQSGKMLVLLDTEGLADPEKGDATHDVWIFCLAILLSSTFIYNSKGVIDNNSLQDLQLTSELSTHIKLKKGGGDQEDMDEAFPSFIWAVRDFFLKPEVDGKTVTADEYLELILQLKKGRSAQVVQSNNVRRSIRDNFKNRTCFLFPFPTQPDKLQELEELTFEELEQAFLETSETFKNYVLENSTSKVLKEKAINGRMFLTLATSYVESIARGVVPVIETAMDYLAEVENQKAKEKALTLFTTWSSSLMLPLPSSELNSGISAKQKEAIKVFSTHCIFDDEQKHSADMASKLADHSEGLVNKNNIAAKEKCEAILTDSFNEVEEKCQKGNYIQANGYEEYQEDFLFAMEVYTVSVESLEGGEEVLAEYRQKTETQRHQIINADTRLGEEEKKIRLLEVERQEEENRKKAALSKLEQLRLHGEEMERNYQEGLLLYKKEMEERSKIKDEEQRQRLERKLKEQENVLRRGHKEESDKLRVKLERLVGEQQSRDDRAREENRKIQRLEQQMQQEVRDRDQAHQREMDRLRAIANRPPPRRQNNCTLS